MSRNGSLVFLFVIFLMILAISSVGFAGTVGNTASTDTPKGGGVFSLKQSKDLPIKAGFDAEFLFGRDLKGKAATNTKMTSAQWYLAKISTVLFDRIEPYVQLGGAHLHAKWTESGKDTKLESSSDFAWGLGGKVLIYELTKPKIKFITDAFYRVADLDVDKGTYGGSSITIDESKSRCDIQEWQIALLAATEIDLTGPGKEETLGVSTLIPYLPKYTSAPAPFRLNSISFQERPFASNPTKYGLSNTCLFSKPPLAYM